MAKAQKGETAGKRKTATKAAGKNHKEVDYASFGSDFHEEMLSSPNPVRRWFHNSKNTLVLNTVLKYYRRGVKIADLGCGTVNWNGAKLPVTGVDLNLKMLQKAEMEGRLSDFRAAQVHKTGLKSSAYAIVVISEVLEHLHNYPQAIKEIGRILRSSGVCIATVPFDTNLSMWKPLFALQCFLYGTILGNKYFQNEAGHVNHFSPRTIADAFREGGFEIERQFDNARFTIFTIARKSGREKTGMNPQKV